MTGPEDPPTTLLFVCLHGSDGYEPAPTAIVQRLEDLLNRLDTT